MCWTSAMLNGASSILASLKRYAGVIVVFVLCGVGVSVWIRMVTDQRIMYVLHGDCSYLEFERLWESRQYGPLVELMEEECNRFDATMAELGGMEKFIIKRGRAKEDGGHGMSDLDGYMEFVNHNDRYIPGNVHMFVKGVAVSGAESLELASYMSRSRHPMVKSYGLWILKHREEVVNKNWKSNDIGDLGNYPAIEAYRQYAYEHAARGEAWAFGFAADATRYDSDVPRALGFLENFETIMSANDEVYAYWLPVTDCFFCEVICAMAERSTESFKNLNGNQTAFFHRILNGSMQTDMTYSDSNIRRLFQIMNRQSDIPIYEARLKENKKSRNVAGDL